MDKREFLVQWTDFYFLVRSSGGTPSVLRDKMVEAGILKRNGRGVFAITIPKTPKERRKLIDTLR